MEKKENIQIRVTSFEKKEIEAIAKKLGLTVSDYVRLVCLNAVVKIEVEDIDLRRF